jgi:hypothetical protein
VRKTRRNEEVTFGPDGFIDDYDLGALMSRLLAYENAGRWVEGYAEFEQTLMA